MLGLDVALLTCLVLGPTADLTSTEVGLARGMREGNGLMHHRGVRITFTTGAVLAQYRVLEHKSRGVKIAGCVASLAHRGVVTYLNVKQIQKQEKKP